MQITALVVVVLLKSTFLFLVARPLILISLISFINSLISFH